MSYLHRAWAEIDLDALRHNFETVRNATDSKIFSVVKANAYGHAVERIAGVLDSAGTYGFAVSNIEEAEELRRFGIKKPVLILGYTPAYLAEKLSELDIIQTVFSLEYAKKLDINAQKSGCTVRAHIKLDTGMGRIGFNMRSDELSGLCEAKEALRLKHLSFEGAFMHFSVADSSNTDDTAYTEEQFDRFLRALAELEKDGFTFGIKHCCNSAATLMHRDKHMDAVRPGIILYGLAPSPDIELGDGFSPVMSFKAAVSQVKTVSEAECISYGRTFKTEKPMRLATLTVGYADGYPRLLSNTGYVLINGKKAPVVGRICMDQMCVDVTDIENVSEGDIATLFGKGLAVETVADFAGTINYEIVCGLSKRVPRVYIENGKVI